MRRLRRLCLAAAAVVLTAAGSAWAQEAAPAAPGGAAPFLTVDQDRIFSESLWGKRVLAEIETASTDLQAENRKIEAALTTEEKTLTDRRPGLAPDEFRKLADDFDSRVVGIRQAQEGKAADLTRKRDEERQAFFQAALPIMGEVMRERGAVAILDNRAIFLSVRAIDATDDIIARLNERLGDRPLDETATPPAEPAPAAPGQTPEPAPQPVPDGSN